MSNGNACDLDPPAPVAEPVRVARGFAGLTPEARRQMAAQGGRAAHASGRAHQFSAAEAIQAGRLGGLQVSADRHHMAALGRLGSATRIARRAAASNARPSVDSDRDHCREETP